MKFVLLTIKLIFSLTGSTNAKNNSLRILGGRIAGKDGLPYVVAVVITSDINNLKRFCTGAVISPRWTLTAAHCNYGYPSIGVEYKEGIAPIFEFKSHPKFPSLNFDIGLLNHETIIINSYGRLSAMEYTAVYGDEALCVGYGANERVPKKNANPNDKTKQQFDYKMPEGLMVLNCLVIRCAFNTNVRPRICVTVSCDEKSTIRSIAPGDSGSPLIHGSGIVGVAAAVTEGHRQGYAGYYMPVSYFFEWIRKESKEVVKRFKRVKHVQ